MTIVQNDKEARNWKTQAYVVGLVAGAGLGLVSAFMYARAAEESAQRLGKPAPIQTGEVLGLGLAALAMVRQITEMGRGPEKPPRRR
jgi:Co/Zn/Cd efflux system component